ncbi:unnamed protein product [Peronospora destructor]|uniref:BZIP domain-containing protein n=1 Tax=Peronospora destructor TaxID=86335 RepID=A0AAV0T259_9STRA|nr:unnamed protein product [Peronospora destructor]
MSQNLERLSVFAARITDDLEPLDSELIMLIAAAADTLLPKEVEVSDKRTVDDFEPLNPSSTPMAVDAYSEPIKKISKRSKKCTYAARRREVAFLRQELVVLEIRLNEMRKNQFVSRRTREQADRERMLAHLRTKKVCLFESI